MRFSEKHGATLRGRAREELVPLLHPAIAKPQIEGLLLGASERKSTARRDFARSPRRLFKLCKKPKVDERGRR